MYAYTHTLHRGTGRNHQPPEGRWQVLDATRNIMSLHADKLRLVVAAEEREDVD